MMYRSRCTGCTVDAQEEKSEMYTAKCTPTSAQLCHDV